MKENSFAVFIKGLIVGGTMIIPGVSGATMAMILGIYDALISGISSFRQNPRQNISFLMKFALGGGMGLFLFANPLSWLLNRYESFVMFFFIGVVFGGIPLIERKSGLQRLSMKTVGYMVLGVVIVLGISSIPAGIFSLSSNMVLLFLVGLLAAVALVLPGISISHLFLILGMYEEILIALKTLDILMFLPVAAGVLAGSILFSKCLERCMTNYPQQTYLMILGFILGSVVGIFPGFPEGGQFIGCIAVFLLGFFLLYCLQERFEH